MQLIEHDNLFGAMEYGFEQLGPMLRRVWWLGLVTAAIEPVLHALPAIAMVLLSQIIWLPASIFVALVACSTVSGRSATARDVGACAISFALLSLWWLPFMLLPLKIAATALFCIGYIPLLRCGH